jgi:hypothetical protein
LKLDCALNDLYLIAGLVLGGFSLRTFASAWLRRLGSLVILGATYLTGAAIFGNSLGAWLLVSLWFVIPATGLVMATRRVSFPLEKHLRYRQAPSAEDFPELPALTEKFLAAGFELHDDIAWDWEAIQQFTRLFIHPELKLQGAIHLHTQETMLFSFVSITTRSADQRWITWNSPFQSAMKWPPGVNLHSLPLVESVEDLISEHQKFTEGKLPAGTLLSPEPTELLRLAQEEGRRQVDHNLDAGLLELRGNGHFSYSWKGCWFMVRQFMIDFVRLS